MPTACIDTKGTEYSFTDSGPVVGSSDYTTLVIYHGTLFNGESFRKLFPLLDTTLENIRLIIISRRSYRGTTKHTDAEIASLAQGSTEFLEVLAQDVANFLIWVINNLDIPKVGADRKSGGLAIMGWSAATSTTLALLGQPQAIPRESYDKIEPYLRKLIIYDSPLMSFGYDFPPEAYNPFIDQTSFTSPQEWLDHLNTWLSGYYSHPDTSSRALSGLDTTSKRTNQTTMDTLTDGEKQTFIEVTAAATGADLGATPYPIIHGVVKEQTKRALFDAEIFQDVLPLVTIEYIACLKTNWVCLWAFFETERIYEELVAEGKKIRPAHFIAIKGANHFVHFDAPEEFGAAIAEALTK
ncbi:uncharacterized protein EV420DRAFT_55064 [Desarmillaria tabescens]|uniref:AB hydrolase-1 domain-containing protein n=1 Tax=Armillaria tabescens TaxID=1929756 RepID=A0AA39NPZ9_ARMTA|nr:uncharacterized protein EV420DRAFT_55064 [Desarmillaria tabescens]KAK0469656.1 hypothetical protein EV420DRAFT_55064 [Desarmillaria tabescens]